MWWQLFFEAALLMYVVAVIWHTWKEDGNWKVKIFAGFGKPVVKLVAVLYIIPVSIAIQLFKRK